MPSWELQRAVAALILDVTSEDGFVLAGSGAIREHGLTDRPTQDVDLFTLDITQERFAEAVGRASASLSMHGFTIAHLRSAAFFARLVVAKDADQLEVDFGVDWRSREPVTFDLGPVLAVEDAVANKVGALYSRAAPRDFLDVDAIRESERFDDNELLRLAADHDPGFELAMFADQLALVSSAARLRSPTTGSPRSNCTRSSSDSSAGVTESATTGRVGPTPKAGRDNRPPGPARSRPATASPSTPSSAR